MSAAPAPQERSDLDAKIDAALARIDAALPAIHKRIADSKADESAPSLTPSPETCQLTFQRTQQALVKLVQEMKDSDTFDIAVRADRERRKAERTKS